MIDCDSTSLVSGPIAGLSNSGALAQLMHSHLMVDKQVAVSVPGPTERLEILRLHAKNLPPSPDFDLEPVAAACHGYTGADLAALCREAAMASISMHARRGGNGLSGADAVSLIQVGSAMT